LALTKQCLKNQFPTTFIDGCADCPENPKTSCKAEGDDAKSCEQHCIKGKHYAILNIEFVKQFFFVYELSISNRNFYHKK
jgi:hypothetical protein